MADAGRMRVVVLICSILMTAGTSAYAQFPLVSLVPQSQQVMLDSSVTVRMHIDSVAWLHGYHVRISYDLALVKCRNIRSLQFFQTSSLFFPTIDTLHGTATADEAILGLGSQEGSGDIAELTFVGLSPGTAALAVAEISLRDTANNEIAVQTQGGSIQVEQPNAIVERVNRQWGEGVHVFPNPCNPSATIRFVCREPGETTLSVYTLLGDEVFSSRDFREPGDQFFIWDGRTNLGGIVPSGMYIIRVATRTSLSTARLIVLR